MLRKNHMISSNLHIKIREETNIVAIAISLREDKEKGSINCKVQVSTVKEI